MLKKQLILDRVAEHPNESYVETAQATDSTRQYVLQVRDAAKLPRLSSNPPARCRHCGKLVKRQTSLCHDCYSHSHWLILFCDWCGKMFWRRRNELRREMKEGQKSFCHNRACSNRFLMRKNHHEEKA